MEVIIEGAGKKLYISPQLTAYGDVKRLTQSNGDSTTGDNTQHTNNKRRNTLTAPSNNTAPKKRRN